MQRKASERKGQNSGTEEIEDSGSEASSVQDYDELELQWYRKMRAERKQRGERKRDTIGKRLSLWMSKRDEQEAEEADGRPKPLRVRGRKRLTQLFDRRKQGRGEEAEDDSDHESSTQAKRSRRRTIGDRMSGWFEKNPRKNDREGEDGSRGKSSGERNRKRVVEDVSTDEEDVDYYHSGEDAEVDGEDVDIADLLALVQDEPELGLGRKSNRRETLTAQLSDDAEYMSWSEAEEEEVSEYESEEDQPKAKFSQRRR